MNNVYFTSDTHFGHKNCATLFRGFKSVHEHDQTLIHAWNSLVGRNDTVYHLGDFSLAGMQKCFDYQAVLNGRIHFIYGNHDSDVERLNKACRSLFKWHKDVEYRRIQGQKVFMSHYAHKVWRSSHYGSWHLYGHSHGSLPDDPYSLSMDVGVDTNNWKPYSFEEVKRRMDAKIFKPTDHHGLVHEKCISNEEVER